MPDRLRVSGFGRQNALGKRVQDHKTNIEYTLVHVRRWYVTCEDKTHSQFHFRIDYFNKFYVLNP